MEDNPMLKFDHRRQPRLRLLALTTLTALALGGCQTTDPYTGEQKTANAGVGAGVGAVGGAVAGAILSGGKRKGVLIGAGLGALTGAAVGDYMDKEESKLRTKLQGTGVSVTRVGNSVVLNMPGNITFATDSSSIVSGFYEVLDSVALVINEYKQTYVDVVGHTDSTGPADYNQRLSEARASSVARYLESQHVLPERILVRGMGETAPIASNATAQGRAQNRRVEIHLTPLT
jgi:outer membrane protein OmpA-like peptidoglycan-associated protein